MRHREALELMDWRRRIAELYAAARAADDPAEAWKLWCRERDHLFQDHAQSPLSGAPRERSSSVSYFDYDPAARVLAEVTDVAPARYEIPTSGTAPMVFDRIATASFDYGGEALTLEIYWLDVYGGGMFVPFRDATSGTETYGAGRYLIDSIKGADLGTLEDRLVFDLNFAYNPSCSYDPRWVCPLAPLANNLPVEVRAGEKTEREKGP